MGEEIAQCLPTADAERAFAPALDREVRPSHKYKSTLQKRITGEQIS
jgi:hypothetical protein